MAVDCNETVLRCTTPTAVVHNLSALTMMAWIKLDDWPERGGVLSIDFTDGGFRKTLFLNNDDGNRVVGAGIIYSDEDAYSVAPCPSLSEWHHIAMRWASAVNDGKADVFIDGEDATSGQTTPVGTPAPDGGGIRVAAMMSVGFSFPILGQLADVAIFNRRLTDAELLRIGTGKVRPYHLGAVWCMTLDGVPTAVPQVGDAGLKDLTAANNDIDSVTAGAGIYAVQPPLPRLPRNGRPSMGVHQGHRLGSLMGACR